MREEHPERARFEAALSRELAGVLDLSPPQLGALWQHYALLTRWRTRVNLISDTRLENVVRKHYCESLLLGLWLPREALAVADVGTGAGFPGIPIAILRPECRITLIESRARKAVFLKEATRSLPNATVAHCRAEDLDLRFDWLVCRALAWDEISQLVPRLSPRVALIVSTETAQRLSDVTTMHWEQPVPIPWRRAGVLLFGTFHVERQNPT
ncbi:MAG: 16S rRNA (guanine(527)-N(7))-methyltransferase RsmG [Bryobacterales bacterium]|nr:16S rRNA (guanine(527)-N(7))-methyltransferase RsmG [Bryobacterales bacterium]